MPRPLTIYSLFFVQLAARLLDICRESGREDGKTEVDMLKWLGKATLDIIGVLGLLFPLLYQSTLF